MNLHEIYNWYSDLDTVTSKKTSIETLRVLRKYIDRLGQKRRASSLSVEIISKDRQKRLKNAKPTTSNNEVSRLREMLNQAFLHGLIKRNPIKDINLLKCDNVRVVNLNEEDIGRLVNCSPGWLAPIVDTATKMPMRKTEITGLKWEEIYFNTGETGILRLSPARTKNNKGRAIPLHPGFRKYLEKARKESKSEYVFPYQSVIKKQFSTAFDKARKKAGLDDITFHDLRHVCITQMFEMDFRESVIMHLAGLNSNAMFRRYHYLREEMLYNLSWSKEKDKDHA